MTGEHIRANGAAAIDLVRSVVEDDEAMPTALAPADRLTRGSLSAISAFEVPVNEWIKFMSNLARPFSLAMDGMTMSGTAAAEPRPPSARSASRALRTRRRLATKQTRRYARRDAESRLVLVVRLRAGGDRAGLLR